MSPEGLGLAFCSNSSRKVSQTLLLIGFPFVRDFLKKINDLICFEWTLIEFISSFLNRSKSSSSIET